MQLREYQTYRTPDGGRFLAEKQPTGANHEGWLLRGLPEVQADSGSDGAGRNGRNLWVLPDGAIIRMVLVDSNARPSPIASGEDGLVLLPVGGSALRFRQEPTGWSVADLTEECPFDGSTGRMR